MKGGGIQPFLSSEILLLYNQDLLQKGEVKNAKQMKKVLWIVRELVHGKQASRTSFHYQLAWSLLACPA